MTIFTRLFFLYIIIYLFMQARFFSRLLTPRSFLRHPFWQCYGIGLVLMLPGILLKDTNRGLSTICINLSLLLFSLLLFENPISKRISGYVSWYLVSTVGESLASFACSVIYRFTGVKLFPLDLSDSDGALPILASLALSLVFVFLAYKGTMALLGSRFNYISPLLLLELAFPIIMSQMVLSVLYTSRSKTQYWVLAAATAFVYIYTLFPLRKGMQKLNRQEQRRLNNEAYKFFAQEQTAKFQNLEKEYRDLRKWNHDMSNHLISLSYLFTEKCYEEAKEYADTLLQKNDAE